MLLVVILSVAEGLAQAEVPKPVVNEAEGGLDIKITLKLENELLSNFLDQISKLTHLSLAYSGNVTDGHTVTIDVKDKPAKEVLEQVLTNANLTYKLVGKSIMISQKKNSSESENPDRSVRGEPGTITGTVRDKSNTPMPGVSIYIKGTNTGTTTNAEGNFTVDAKPDDVLVFTFIGYKKVEEPIGSRTTIDLIMEDETNTLQEVVINGGYYETTDKLKTGSIVKVTAKEIENQPVTSPLMALQGRVSGLEINPGNGAPGTAPIIRIRGSNSLRMMGKGIDGVGPDNDGNYPLYVVDGVPISSVPVLSFVGSEALAGPGFDPLSTINPANILSIEILKDGDATAIYGSRGANGVILITTKNNKNTDRTNIDLKFYSGVGKVSKRIETLSTSQYVNMRKEALANEPTAPQADWDIALWDTTRYTDWQEVLLGGTANINDLQGSLSSGNKTTTFTLGGSYHKETLVFPGDFGYRSGTANLSLNHTSIDQRLKVSANMNYGINESDMFDGDFVSAALTLPPNAPAIYDDAGNLNWEIHAVEGLKQSTWINPMSNLLKTQEVSNKSLYLNSNLSYEIFPKIALSVNTGWNDFLNDGQIRNPIISLQPQFLASGEPNNLFGSATFTGTKVKSWIVEPKLSVSRNWKGHGLNVNVGTTWQSRITQVNTILASRYASDALLGSLRAAGKLTAINDNFSEYKYASMYVRAGYNFSDRYLINLTGRRDGSSRFGTGNRFVNFWSVGTAWIFSNENLVKKALPFLNFGKVRASYGTTGSDNIGDYSYYNLYVAAPATLYQGLPGYIPGSLYNSNFAWEETRKLEFAVELAFVENRLGAEINWYRNRSSNQLVGYPLPATSGFPTVLQNFDATVQNTGFEILLRGNVISRNDWQWDVSLNVSLPDNKLVEFDGIEDTPYATVYKVGEPLSIQWLYTFKGVNPQSGLYEFEDFNDDGLINNLDRKLMNPRTKTYYGGVINTIKFKSVEISFLLQFSNQKMLRYITTAQPGAILVNQPVNVLKRWQHSGDITSIQRFSIGGQNELDQTDGLIAYGNLLMSNVNITDASFVRFKTLSISYPLPVSWIERLKFQQLKIFVQGQNLFTITKYEGLDPETGMSLPPLCVLTAGVQARL